MKDDLTTFERQRKSQIFVITNGAKVTIANLRIHGSYPAGSSHGGAVAIREGSRVTIRNCIIKEARNYGAISVNTSKLTLQSSDIRNNKNPA